MNWLTQKQVKDEAKKGRKAALFCCWLHWHQCTTATNKEIIERRIRIEGMICFNYCAMCRKYFDWPNDCPKCVLQCHEMWRVAERILSNLQYYTTSDNYHKWRKASRAILAKIERTIERLYGEKGLKAARSQASKE